MRQKNNLMRRLFGILLTICLVFGTPVSVLADESAGADNAASTLMTGECGENAVFTYDQETKTLTISGTGAMHDYSGGGASPWGSFRGSIKTVVVEEGITYLGKNMLNKATSLTSITLPSSLESVGFGALANCTALTELSFSEGLKIIGPRALVGCSSLKTIYLPGTLEAIDLKAFEKSGALKEIYYNGTEGQWNQIMISQQALGNGVLMRAKIHYLKDVQTFTDVPADSEYYDAVTYLTDNGYLNVEEALFDLDGAADAEMILSILYQRAGAPGMYASAQEWAVENGLIDSDKANQELNVIELAVVLYRTMLIWNAGGSALTGISAEEENRMALEWCEGVYGEQLYSENDNADKQPITRGKAARIMAVYLQDDVSSMARRNGLQLDTLKKALSVEGGDGRFYIYALDLTRVGANSKQGDCMFILFPNGETMLIDSAYKDSQETVIGMLETLGITHLDHLMFSHSDSDHIGNAAMVVNYLKMNVDNLYLNNIKQNKYASLVNTLSNSAEIKEMRRGDEFQIGEVKVQVLNPSSQYIDDYNAGREEQNNDSSLTVKFVYGESTFLTGGDLYERMELELVEVYGDQLQADILKANHHAAYTSNVDAWIDAVDPLVLFAETDDNGMTSLVNSAAEKGIAYYTYGFDGSILIMMNDSRNYEVITQKDSVLRKNYTGEIGTPACRLPEADPNDQKDDVNETEAVSGTDAADNTEAADVNGADDTADDEGGNFGLIVVGVAAVVCMMAAAAVVIQKKKYKK